MPCGNDLAWLKAKWDAKPTRPDLSVQFAWSPTRPQQCAVVSEQGQLYTGNLGRKLKHIEAYSNVTCTAWSVDNEMLAVGINQQVHVWDVQQHTERFQAVVQVQVRLQASFGRIVSPNESAIMTWQECEYFEALHDFCCALMSSSAALKC